MHRPASEHRKWNAYIEYTWTEALTADPISPLQKQPDLPLCRRQGKNQDDSPLSAKCLCCFFIGVEYVGKADSTPCRSACQADGAKQTGQKWRGKE